MEQAVRSWWESLTGKQGRRLSRARAPSPWAIVIGGGIALLVVLYCAHSSAWQHFIGLEDGSYQGKKAKACGGFHKGRAVSTGYFKQRAALYEKMAADIQEKGAEFLQGGTTSQSLKLADIFTVEDGHLRPVHKALDVPVRATVLHLDPSIGAKVFAVVHDVLSATFPETAVWYQDPDVYHMSMYHASHHLDSVEATPDEVALEKEAVQSVVNTFCPLHIALDRVLVTSTGVLLGCWQLLDGTEPATLRQRLQESLPRSPKKQLYDKVMLHTSFARILGPPTPLSGKHDSAKGATTTLTAVVRNLNKQLCGLQTTVQELWYVEEQDLLALALQGRMRKHVLKLQCPLIAL